MEEKLHLPSVNKARCMHRMRYYAKESCLALWKAVVRKSLQLKAPEERKKLHNVCLLPSCRSIENRGLLCELWKYSPVLLLSRTASTTGWYNWMHFPKDARTNTFSYREALILSSAANVKVKRIQFPVSRTGISPWCRWSKHFLSICSHWLIQIVCCFQI